MLIMLDRVLKKYLLKLIYSRYSSVRKITPQYFIFSIMNLFLPSLCHFDKNIFKFILVTAHIDQPQTRIF